MQSNQQIFCFTYAGGTGDFFDAISSDLCGIDTVRLEYAGHGARHKENFYRDFDELGEDLFERFKATYCGKKYALFGYSMGSISLVEVLKRIIAERIREPQCVFLAAHEPHTKSELFGFSCGEIDEWVKKRTIAFGGVPDNLIDSSVFWRTYLPVYRADYTLISQYRFEQLDMRLDIPAVVFYSEADTPLEDMKQWERYFPCEFHEFSGTHFFIRDHHIEMADIIRDKLVTKNDI